MEDLITIDSIISYLKEAAEQNESLPPSRYLDAARSLNALLSGEIDKLATLEQQINKMIATYISEGHSVAAAEIKVRAEDIYREMQKQKGKIKMVLEFIRLAKLQSRLLMEEFKGY